MSGINLANTPALGQRSRVFGEIFDHSVHDVDQPLASLRFRWVIEGRFKLIVPHPARLPGQPVELFDVVADPTEENNLAASMPERVRELTAALKAWWPDAIPDRPGR